MDGDEASDLQIVEAVLQGETDRYRELVQRYQLAAWRLAFTFVGNLEDARELAQNAFVNAFRSLGRFRRQSKFSTWLYRILANECKDFLRRKSREPTLVPLDGNSGQEEEDPAELFEVADPRGDPRHAVFNKELGARLAHAIGRLPMKQRWAFLLHEVNGLPIEEAAQVMGCRAGTVKVHLFRAAQSLRLSLAPLLAEEVLR